MYRLSNLGFKINFSKTLPKGSILLVVFLCFASLFSEAQKAQTSQKKNSNSTTAAPADSLAMVDSLASESIEHLLMVGATIGNNSSYLGRYQSARLPYYATDITYRHKSGWWASATAYQVLNSTSFIDEVDLMAGWNVDLSKKVDASFYYSRFFFSPESDLLKASVANSINASAGLDWGYVYTRLNGSLLFGESTDFFLVLDNSRYFEIEKVLHKKDYLSFEPRISLIAGTQTFVEKHLGRSHSPISSPVNSPLGGGRPGGGGGPSAPGGTESQSSTTAFNIITYELSLPVSYTYHKTSLELAGRYTLPVNQLEGDSSTPQLFLTASIYLAIY